MLQSIHDKLKGWLAGVVLSAIGLVFVFWGINWTLSAPNYAAKVNGIEISSSEVREAYQRQLAQFERLTPPDDEEGRRLLAWIFDEGRLEALVAEAGGCCQLCGYDRYVGALEFHHVDPARKSFGLSIRGLTPSIATLCVEAQKCVLLCSNCHAEVEDGMAAIPANMARGPTPG